MTNIKIFSLILFIYFVGVVITYIITKYRAHYVIEYSIVDKTDEEIGVVIFSILSFLGLFIFLIGRLISIIFKQIDKLFKL